MGIQFSHVRQEISTYNTHTFYISYIGPFPGKAKEIKIDITYREILVDSVEEKSIIKTYEEYSDFLQNPTVRVYSLKEIAIEKTCTLFTPFRNEPRDLFDFYYLISEAKVDLDNLNEYVDRKLKFKGSSLKERSGEFLKKEKRLKKLWDKRLSIQMFKELPEYENVFRIVKRTYRQLDL